ncbi:hypothetical protein NMY22_g19785 [Coprinellus aureogranulatus]|nr:hypothetical protein NMY22_g19785 [Coprinellus aureogranulatus]
MASGTALLWQGAARLPTGPGATIGSAAQPGAPRRAREASLMTPPSSYFRDNASTTASTQASLLERKRQLEAELAALNAASGAPGSPESGELRSREGTNSGRFEEVEVPSDVEGYDVGEGEVLLLEAAWTSAEEEQWVVWRMGERSQGGIMRGVKSELSALRGVVDPTMGIDFLFGKDDNKGLGPHGKPRLPISAWAESTFPFSSYFALSNLFRNLKSNTFPATSHSSISLVSLSQ